jgi:hypothetical protein
MRGFAARCWWFVDLKYKLKKSVIGSGLKGSGFKEGFQLFNPERGTVNLRIYIVSIL